MTSEKIINQNPNRNLVLKETRLYFDKLNLENKKFIPGETPIPVTKKIIDADDLCYLVESVLDMHFTSGRFSSLFEKELANICEVKHKALLVNSGSSANLLALSSLCQKEMLSEFDLNFLSAGDEVITAAAGFPTTVSPIMQNGLIPKFVDIELDNLNPTEDMILNAITPKTKAIMLAHALGNPYRSDRLKDYCDENGIYLIEDCCDALGSEIKVNNEWKPIGSFGTFASISFYPAHHITTGEGGALLAANAKYRRIAESMRDWGRHCWCETGCDNTCKKRFEWQFAGLPYGYDHKYIYSSIGYNLKLTDFQAALGYSQSKKLKTFVEARRKNWQSLKKGVIGSPVLNKFFSTIIPTEDTNPSWFGFGLRCINGLKRNSVIQHLEKRKIATRLLFGGNLTKQPAFKNINYIIADSLKNTDIIMNDFFWIGVHPGINEEQISFILTTLEESVKLEKL
ncbi:WecE Predicted pyridoxal phosphate-dependent enzyme apparently involved in regulation of cell wall biogenesis [Candidatus Methylopumilus universalis]